MATLGPTDLKFPTGASRLEKSPSLKHFNVARESREGQRESELLQIDSAPVQAGTSRKASFAASSNLSQETGVPTRQSYMDMDALKQSYVRPSATLQPPLGLNLPQKYYVTDIRKRRSTWHWVPSMRAYIPDREVPPGTKVRLANLASAEGEVWNNVECEVKSFDSESWRYTLTVPPSVLCPLGAEIVCAADNIQLGEDMEPLTEYADMIHESVEHQQRLSSKTYIPRDSKAPARKSGRDFKVDSFPARSTEWLTAPPEKLAVEPSTTPPKAAPADLTLLRNSSVSRVPLAQMQPMRASQPTLTQARLSSQNISPVTLATPPMMATDQIRQRIAQQTPPREPVIAPLHPALGAPRFHAPAVPAQDFMPYQRGQMQRMTTGSPLQVETFKPYQAGQTQSVTTGVPSPVETFKTYQAEERPPRMTAGTTPDRYTEQGFRILAEYPRNVDHKGAAQHYYATGYAPWMSEEKEKGETTEEAVAHAAQKRPEQDMWKIARTKIQATKAFAPSGADLKTRESEVAPRRKDSTLDVQRAQSSSAVIPRMTYLSSSSRRSLLSTVPDDTKRELMKLPGSTDSTAQRGFLREFTVVPSRSKPEIIAPVS